MNIIEVNNCKTRMEFLDCARIIYKDDKNWICPLDKEIEAIFSPSENVFFTFGEAKRWILKDSNGNLIGRIAAFINKKKAYNFEQPTGGVGFFECIDDYKAAKLLFDTAREYLSSLGMEAMDGPINFGENDNYWGLLVEGFDPPFYGMQYHLPYYKDFFEKYRFKPYFEQVSNLLNLKQPFPERFWKIAEWIGQKKEYSFEHFTYKKKEKYIDDFAEIYNIAWAFHENFTPINRETLYKSLGKAKSILEEEFIWFAYANGEPVGFLFMLPDINQIIKHLNGKLHLFNKIKFWYLKQTKAITRARIVIMGIKPQYQKSGVESGIFWHLDKVLKRKPHYTEVDLSWVGDFNPKMRALHEAVGAKFAKRHITYRCVFSNEKEFHRSTIIPMNTKEKVIKND